MDYYSVYLKRLNRYGKDYETRIQTQREELFERLLNKSIYRIDFVYKRQVHPGTFEKYKQDNTRTLHYLLTRLDLDIPNGTVLMLPKDASHKKEDLEPWMVYYLEKIPTSGYNRYIMLRMTHLIKWKDRQGKEQSSWAYMYGQENNMLKDELKSRSRSTTLYTENLKTSFFIMPLTPYIRKDDYIEVGEGDMLEAYVVTGYDRQSSEGVEYVTIDPVYIRDKSPIPKPLPEDDQQDFFWLLGED